MILDVDGLPVYFPYERVYPEQLSYIVELKRSVESGGYCLIEMPSGSGKTMALLSFVVSYQLGRMLAGKPRIPLLYATRTVSEVRKTASELKVLIEYITCALSDKSNPSLFDEAGVFRYTGICLASRKVLCVNSAASCSDNVDLACHRLVSSGACEYFTDSTFAYGVHTIDGCCSPCPYYLSRNSVGSADCVVLTYNYLVDPRIYDVMGFRRGSFLIFDEAHNIDNVCTESLSFEINRPMLDSVTRALQVIRDRLEDRRSAHAQILEDEYKRLRARLKGKEGECIASTYNRVTSGELHDYVPGNLRSAIHFLSVLRRLVEFMKTKLRTSHLTVETTSFFCQNVKTMTFVDQRALAFCSQRFSILSSTLGLERSAEMRDLGTVCGFVTLAAQFKDGFSVVCDGALRLVCLDASIAFGHIDFPVVIVTSGTLSPIQMYTTILGLKDARVAEIGNTLVRNSASPLIITKGNDQMMLYDGVRVVENSAPDTLTSSFFLRSEPFVVRNYGNLIVDLCRVVPDGIVVFFPSYVYMEEIVPIWADTILSDVAKLIFIETPDEKETAAAMESYKRSIRAGRGAIFFCVARGKLSEGIDLSGGFGRCVVMLGIPFRCTESVDLRERLRFMSSRHCVKELDYLNFDAMRHTAQCLGRVLRSKSDYGLMILADKRFKRTKKKARLPKWISNCIEEANENLSVDMAIEIAKRFFKEMAQPAAHDDAVYLDSGAANQAIKKIMGSHEKR